MSDLSFYHSLHTFKNFEDIGQSHYFHKAPEDWWLIIADIVNSTIAIEQGRYKDVNTIGAAVVVAVENALENQDIPFVFGGDGASLLIPPEYIEQVRYVLSGLRQLAHDQFNLELRIAQIQIAEVFQAGFNIEIAKYQLGQNKAITIFRGGGILAVDKLIKQKLARYEIPHISNAKADLTGLSCRWNPIPSQAGRVVSLLVLTRNLNSSQVYQNVLSKLTSLYAGQLEKANPVKISQMSYKTIGECFRDEIRQHSPKWAKPVLLRLLEIIFAVGIFRFHLPFFNFNATAYKNSLPIYSDYRKFDDLLRMIIDCTPTQLSGLHEYLETCYQNGELYYGLHESSDCLMTCYVQNMQDGGHIHFIDGGDGGYAVAAKQLKSTIDKMSRF